MVRRLYSEYNLFLLNCCQTVVKGLTGREGLVYITCDGEGLVGAAFQDQLQLGYQHDGLQSSQLCRHQLSHAQLVTHHALVRLQRCLELQPATESGRHFKQFFVLKTPSPLQ